MTTGKVKWFNNAKGYGFVLAECADEDLFVHYSSIEMTGYRTLRAGQEVSFDIQQGPKGLHAVNVRPLDVPEEPSAGEREGLAPRMEEPSAGEREGLAPRMEEPSAGEREGLAPRMEEPSAGEREGLAPRMGSQPPAASADTDDGQGDF